MLSLIRKSLAPENKSYWFWGVALFALFVEICFHALLPISISNDSYGYLHLSQNLGNKLIAFERSVGYPLFLSLLGTNLFDNFIPVILVQAAMAVSMPLIVFSILVRFGLGFAVLGALISCLYFYNFVVSLYILTEPAYVFSIAIYAFFLVRYFQKSDLKNLLLVIASCWLIAMIRVSGTLHFLSLLAGIGLFIFINLMHKNSEKTRLGVKHFLVAVAVFFSISLVQSMVTDRTSSIVWPHFVFNWVYKDSSVAPIYHGIIKPENGPATTKLFKEIEAVVSEHPAAFDTLKAGGTEEVRSLIPGESGKYDKESIKLLMNDLIHNNKHDVRSWWIEGVLKSYGLGIVETSKLLGDAIIESFKEHPEVILKRMDIVIRKRIWAYLTDGINANNVVFPTAYYHQIPKVINTPPSPSLKPGFYKQWAYDLFKHTGNDPANSKISYPHMYPSNFDGALENIKSDNLVGFGHYIAVFGMQILRICWVFIALGILIFPFIKKGQPLLGSLLCASIIPPVASVFMSETDPRHLLMSSPVHIVTAVFALYLFIILCKGLRKNDGVENAG